MPRSRKEAADYCNSLSLGYEVEEYRATSEPNMPNLPADPDHQLYLRLLQRDADAIPALMAKYEAQVIGTLWRVLQGYVNQEELYHLFGLVFALIWSDIDRYDPGQGSLREWILQTAKLVAVWWRRQP